MMFKLKLELIFLTFSSETSCVHIKVELDSESVIAQEHIDTAVKLGVHLSNLSDPVEAKKYVLLFIHKLLFQKEKIDFGQLTDYLKSSVVTTWQAVLSTLEDSNRKLLGVQSGSIIFKVFCPSFSSAQELQDDSWIKTLTQKMEQLFQKIGQK